MQPHRRPIPTVLLALALALLPGALAARPPTGLLDRDTPLPATIPLQVSAPQGRDYAIVLGQTDAPVTRAYLRGGEVLRVLVPPGRFDLSVGAGNPDDWQGPEDLFGAPPRTLPEPLSFRIDGARREGHAIALEITGGALRITAFRNRATCQIADWSADRVTKTTPLGTTWRYLDPELDLRSRPCD